MPTEKNWPGLGRPDRKAGLQTAYQLAAAPDHHKSDPELVFSDDSGDSWVGQIPPGVADLSPSPSYSAPRSSGPLVDDPVVLSQTDEVADGGMCVRLTVVAESDNGARRRWIENRLFRPRPLPVAPGAPEDAEPLGGVRVIARPTAPANDSAAAVALEPALIRV